MDDLSDAARVEQIRQILAEPLPKWFQNARRRANAYAEQLQRTEAVVSAEDRPDDNPPRS